MLTLADIPAASSGATPPDHALASSMTAAEISRAVGGVELDVARRHHVDIATVVAELAQDANLNWPSTHDDPTVALLRALAKISIVAPDSLSRQAASLLRSVGTPSRRTAAAPTAQRGPAVAS